MYFKKRTLMMISVLAFWVLGVINASAQEGGKAFWREKSTIELLSKFAKPADVENADAAGEEDMKEYKEIVSNTPIAMEMVPIKGGTFLMGSSEEEREKFGMEPEPYMTLDNASEGPQHEVEVAPFWMGKYVVTWAEYSAWFDTLEQRVREGEGTEQDKVADAMIRPTPAYTDMTFDMGKDGRPAIAMSLYGAQMYCKWLSVKTGRYYRLPTEAEWEYACRAGTTTAYSFGDEKDDFKDYGWYYDNANDKYQKIGQKKPNPWGLYDMHGNVREWCLDQYAVDGYQKQIDAAGGEKLVNPFFPMLKGKRYPGVARGGSWYDEPENCRSASRYGSNMDWNNADPQIPRSIWFESSQKYIGFRVVRPLTPPTEEEAAAYEPDLETAVNYAKLNPRQPMD